MSDPAIYAAKRSGAYPQNINPARHDEAVAAAREMAKPIRELHYPTNISRRSSRLHCHACVQEWPCATAYLVYTTEELKQ